MSLYTLSDKALMSFRTGQVPPVRHLGGAEDSPSVSITLTTGAASAQPGDSDTFQDTASRLRAVLRRLPGGVACDVRQDRAFGAVEVCDHIWPHTCPFTAPSMCFGRVARDGLRRTVLTMLTVPFD